MARSNTIILAAFSFLITAALAGKPASANDDWKNPKMAAEDLKYLSHISPKEREYLNKCSEYMSQKCDDEVESVMLGKKAKVTHKNDCCTQLVRMGKNCHNHLVKLLVRYPDFKSNATIIKLNSNMVWKDCQERRS